MDLATLLGLIGGLAFVVMAMILGGSIMMVRRCNLNPHRCRWFNLRCIDEVYDGAVFWRGEDCGQSLHVQSR